MNRRAFIALAAAAAAKSKTWAGHSLPTQAAQSVRFIAFGDSGTGDEQQAALARAMATLQ